MADDNATLNNDTGAAGSEAGESSTPETVNLQPSLTDDGYVSTVDFTEADKSPAAEQNTDNQDTGKEAATGEDKGEAKKAGEETGTDKDTGKTGDTDKDVPFHEHPRWKELQADRKADKDKIADLERKLSERDEKPPEKIEPKPVESEWSKLSKDEREDLLEDDPEKYQELFYEHKRQEEKAQEEARTLQQQQQELEEAQIKTFESYSEANEDFVKMWDSGDIQKFMKENPGHNAISAHMSLTHEKRVESITEQVKADLAEQHKAEIEKAKKAAVEDYKAKAEAGTAFSDPGGVLPTETETDPKLQNTSQHGGHVAAIADRLAARRQQTAH